MTLAQGMMLPLLSQHDCVRVAHLSDSSEVIVCARMLSLGVSPVWSGSPRVTPADQAHQRGKELVTGKDLTSSAIITPSPRGGETLIIMK